MVVAKAGVVKLLPVSKAVPPVASANHLKEVPPFGVALNVAGDPAQIAAEGVANVGLG